MSRKALFSDAEVYDAVGRLMATEGSLTIGAVQKAVGVSTGSLYHRFGSREGLLAETWKFALLSFQPHFLEALAEPGIAVAKVAAVTPRFCREHLAEARILSCCNSRQFMGDDTPGAIRARIEETNRATKLTLVEFAQQRGFDLDACRLALIAFPLAAVRQYLPEKEVPASVDTHIGRAAEAILQ